LTATRSSCSTSCAILILLSDVVLGGAAPVIIGALAAAFVAGLWFVLPILRRDAE
jgi:hypothetical protein